MTLQHGTVKQVLSGDSVKIWGAPRANEPPLERQLNLLGINAPKLARRPTNDNKAVTKDEPWAWEAREFLRKKLVGQRVTFTAEKIPNANMEKGIIYIGENNLGENVNELMVSEGLVTIRGDPKNPDIANLLKCEEAAKAHGKGRHGNAQKPVREVHWTHDRDVTKYNYRKLKAIIEHVRDGSTVRAFIMPDDNNVYYYITLMISGIRCSTSKSEAKGDGEQKEDVPDQQDEAKYCVERHLLQRDCEIILMTMNNNNFIGSIIHPGGNIAEVLLKRGFARCVEWSLTYAKKDVISLREAEKFAQERRLGIWKNYVPSTPAIPIKDKEFSGVVAEIINGDSLAVKQPNGVVKKIFLSSIRPPKEKSGDEEGKGAKRPKGFRPLYDIPWMFEARETLRKALIGKKVNISVDYIQPARENLPEKTCCTVMVGKTNIAVELVSKGLAHVVRHRSDDDQRSAAYNALLEAEAKAQKSNVGVYSKKEYTLRKVPYISAEPALAKSNLQTLMRHPKQEAVVEFVTSGSRLKLFISKDSCLVTFLLGGISCPRGARPSAAGGTIQEAEPYGEDALNFTKEKCMQREVNITVESMDKVGGFIGYLWVDDVNLSVALVKEGLATVHSTAERSEHKGALRAAENYAKLNKLNIWKNYVETPKEEERSDDAKTVERKINLEKVLITEVSPEGRFFAQNTEQGPKLEALMNKLHQDFTADPPLPGAYTPKKGDLCAARFSFDNQWYRAKVEKVQGSNVSVLYIDYGNREVINGSSCASLPSSFITDKPYATEYSLACINFPTDSDHKDNAIKALSQDLLNQTLLLNIESKGHIPEVTLMDTSNNDVIKNLISEGLLLVQNRHERRLQKLISDYRAAQEVAKKARLAIWEYGDITEDDA